MLRMGRGAAEVCAIRWHTGGIGPFWESNMSRLRHLVFRPDGVPRGWVRRLVFHRRQPRRGFGWLVLDAEGQPRPAFAGWASGSRPPRKDVPPRTRLLRHGGDLAKTDVVVLVVYARDGLLTPIHRQQISAWTKTGCRVVLVINAGLYIVDPDLPTEPDAILLRENSGFDFGGWRDALNIVPGLDQARSVAFTNDSLLPLDQPMLNAMMNAAQAMPDDVVFLTTNTDLELHAQSYFFLLRRSALAAGAADVLRAVPDWPNKQALIEHVELQLMRQFRARRRTVGILYPGQGKFAGNRTILDWKGLIAEGFPFMKIQLFEEGIVTIDTPDVATLVPLATRNALVDHLEARRAPPDEKPS